MSDSPSPLEPAATPPTSTPARPRQLRLFQVTNPITTRLGPEAFTNLPRCPGVYFFYDATGRLLYIGQSLNLRARVTSYRHVSPERHPRRILRLVHRIARIEWRTCDTPEDAIELERTLLLQHRPPFNRAGTWQAPPWHLHINATGDYLELSLVRPEAAAPASSVLTADAKVPASPPAPSLLEFPLLDRPPSSLLPVSRTIHATLCRCLIRLHHPSLPLSHYPAGLLNLTAPLHLRLPFPGQASVVAGMLTDFLSGRPETLLELLSPLANEIPASHGDDDSSESQLHEVDPYSVASYWAAQVEALQNFAARRQLTPCASEAS